MEHLYPGVLEPVQEVIGNLIAFPGQCRTAAKRRLHQRLSRSEQEEALEQLQRTLSARSAALARREAELEERWDAGRVYSIPIGSIAENPFQPRRTFEELSLFSLANSIREHGILQPLTVRRIPALSLSPGTEGEEGAAGEAEVIAQSYELIAGERRLRAAAAIGMECVPCIVLEADNRRAAELALIENLQRESLNMFEQAAAIAALIDMHAMTQEEIARSLAVSQPTVANKLRILRLTASERDLILTHHLTERHARAFLRIRDLGLRREAVEYTASHGLNVAQTEDYIDGVLARAEAESRVPTKPASAPQTEVTPAEKAHSVSQNASAHGTAARQKTLVLRDLSVFFNTVERAVAAVRESGIAVRSTREETAGEIRYTVILPRGGDGGVT